MPDYAVTAGDVYSLSFLMGTTAVVYTIPVDTTYRIRVANLGVLNCKGLTYSQLKTQVDSLVSKNYPMGGVQFVLVTPAKFQVSVTGEVVKATEHTAWALTRLSSFISSSLTDYSSTRNVTVISEDGGEKNFDLYKAQREGDFSQDPYLRPGDKIVINRYDRRVTINGAVERSGTYEILPGENLKALVEYYANGLQSLADVSRTTLYRITGEKDSGKMLYLGLKDLDADFPLLPYDEVTIASYRDLMSAMFIEGAVSIDVKEASADAAGNVRITVRFTEGEDYAALVRRYSSAFTSVSDLSAAYIIRDDKQIPIDLAKILYDASYYSSETVKDGDTLLVPFRQFFVTVSGAVLRPGRFPYIPDRDWKYYVGLAGGIDSLRNSREKMEILTIEG
ncbi:MAG: SLBB domain-containing protein, partial [Treponemataceae bacterium]|nr:SLBB domain-containing protein [Treponemataceae bacterium]